jgi:catechol 2,3-dioxygenase-like lactoylglutathione lyase family enzyme
MTAKTPKFNRLIPILYVRDLAPEVEFYQRLGFEISYQGEDFPGFIALRKDSIEFGLETRDGFDPERANDSLAWQMEMDSFSKVIAICKKHAIEHSEPQQYWAEMNAWAMKVRTPNGYTLHLEKIGSD